ncbi:MAG: D-aminoacylase [Chloroflexi bacterium]|nr:D-aminoacylase [Chloroflexota bacterium]
MFDLLITNGTIIDGTGNPGYAGSVAVSNGRIAEVGKVSGSATRVIDAEGGVIAPGILDIHTHYDAQIRWDPLATSSCWQGVTTVLIGNCSYSIAPCRPEDRDYLMSFFSQVEGVPKSMLQGGPAWDWETFPEYMQSIDKPMGVNVMAMVGHSPLRYYFLGPEASKRASTDEELAQMKGALREAMDAGAFGFTSNRYYEHGPSGEPIPSRLAEERELFELMEVLRDVRSGFLEIIPTSFMWGPIREDMETLTRLSIHSGRPVLWNQFAHTWEAPDIWREVIAYHQEAADKGARLFALNQCLRFDIRFELKGPNTLRRRPSWAMLFSTPIDARAAMTDDPDFRESLRQELVAKDEESTFLHLMHILYFNRIKSPEYQKWVDRSLDEIAKETGRHPADILLEVAEADGYDTELEYRGIFGGDEDAQAEIINDPYSIVGESDGGAHCTSHVGTGFGTHLLGHWVREKGIMSLEEGVRRLTSMPADAVGLTDRGRLQVGLAADVVVFDPDTVGPGEKQRVNDFPGGEARLVQYATGVSATVVNGEVMTIRQRHEGALPGRLLKSYDYRE